MAAAPSPKPAPTRDSVAAAWASYRFVELPSMALGRRLAQTALKLVEGTLGHGAFAKETGRDGPWTQALVGQGNAHCQGQPAPHDGVAAKEPAFGIEQVHGTPSAPAAALCLAQHLGHHGVHGHTARQGLCLRPHLHRPARRHDADIQDAVAMNVLGRGECLHIAGRIPRKRFASASSPVTATVGQVDYAYYTADADTYGIHLCWGSWRGRPLPVPVGEALVGVAVVVGGQRRGAIEARAGGFQAAVDLLRQRYGEGVIRRGGISDKL